MLKQFRQEGFDLTCFECWTFDPAMAALGEEHKYNKEPADVRTWEQLVVAINSFPSLWDWCA